jgi:Mlc titration factor MtfA (ptsG expression regulator)
MFGLLKNRRRRKLRATALPPAWEAIVRRNVPFYSFLGEADREELGGHIQVFLAEKHFEGCNGLVLSDEIRVTIAAHACLLLLHRTTDYYPRLVTVLVYPEAFVAPVVEALPDGAVLEEEAVEEGEAWKEGVVILSWSEVLAAASPAGDGYNVALHEFAHQLDLEDGEADGTPLLERGQYAAWTKVLEADYRRLVRDVERGRPTVLDDYGATDPAEFFAVATECFFEQPVELREKHRALYEVLQAYYRLDPASLVGGALPRPGRGTKKR